MLKRNNNRMKKKLTPCTRGLYHCLLPARIYYRTSSSRLSLYLRLNKHLLQPDKLA